MATFRPAPRPVAKPVTPPMRPQPMMGQRPAAPPPKMPPRAPAPAFGGSRTAMPPKTPPQPAPAFGGGRPAMPPKAPTAGLPGMFTAGRSMAQPMQKPQAAVEQQVQVPPGEGMITKTADNYYQQPPQSMGFAPQQMGFAPQSMGQKPAGGLQSLRLDNGPMPVLKAGPEYEAQVQRLKGANSPEAQQQFAGELRSMAGGMPDMQKLVSQARQYGLDETAVLADPGGFQRFMTERQQFMAQPQAFIENAQTLSQQEARLAQQRALMERQNLTQFQSPMPMQGNVGPVAMQRLNSMFIPRG